MKMSAMHVLPQPRSTAQAIALPSHCHCWCVCVGAPEHRSCNDQLEVDGRHTADFISTGSCFMQECQVNPSLLIYLQMPVLRRAVDTCMARKTNNGNVKSARKAKANSVASQSRPSLRKSPREARPGKPRGLSNRRAAEELGVRQSFSVALRVALHANRQTQQAGPGVQDASNL